MDLGHFDWEGVMRQRHLDIEERAHDIHAAVRRGGVKLEDFTEMMDICWLFHENGLEGVVLSYPEIRSAVDNKIISDVSLLPTYRDIKNQKQCLDKCRHLAQKKHAKLDKALLEELHALLAPTGSTKGPWRRDIPIHRTYFHEIVAPQQIDAALTKVLENLHEGASQDMHPVEHAAVVHHRFMRAFPFAHASGTIGRLLLNFVLWRENLPPIIIHASDRQRYYEALRGTEQDLHLFVAEALENSLENALRFVAAAQPSAQGSERVAMRA